MIIRSPQNSVGNYYSKAPRALSPKANRDRKLEPRHRATLKELRLQVVSVSTGLKIWENSGT